MNRRSFLKWTGATAAAVLPLPALAGPKNSVDFPFLNIIQPLSPVVGVLGAKPGQLMNTKTKQVYDSIGFVPCYAEHVYTEWGAGPGAFVGTHAWDSDIVCAAKKDASTEFNRYATTSGNVLVETYYLYGLQVKGDKVVTPCVLAFSGAKIKAYRNLMQIVRLTPSINGLLMDVRPPLLAYKLRISTVCQTVRHHYISFFNYRIEPAKGRWKICWDSMSVDMADTLLHVDHPLLKAAVKLRRQVLA